MSSKFASIEARVSSLERVCGLQQQMLNQLATAVIGHEEILEALAAAAGVDLRQQSAPRAPLSTLN